MKILFITNLLPYPFDNGGKIKTYNTLKILSKSNEIDLMCFYEDEEDLVKKDHLYRFCKNIDCIKKPIITSKNINYMLKLAIKNLFSKIPLVAYKYMDKKFENILISKIDKNNYDAIYIDHLQLGGYLDKIKKIDKKYILDEHNAESTIILRKAKQSKNIIKRMYFYYEYKRLRNFESYIINKVDKVIVLSEEDKNILKEISREKDEKFIQIPIPIEIDYEKSSSIKSSTHYNILFLGTLSWFPNSQGIEWFIDNVVPKLDRQKISYSLYVVGKDPSSKLIEIGNVKDNIIVTGFVNDVNEYIEKCDFMVVPLFIGSGMRVKILEAMGKKMPVISTTIGCEGIEVKNKESILIANDEVEFVEAIKYVSNKEVYEEIRNKSKQIFEEQYSVRALEELYLNVIKNKGDINA